MRLTVRQKQIAGNSWRGYPVSKIERKEAKIAVIGHYWKDNDYSTYVSFGPNGKREFFDYIDDESFIPSAADAKKCAVLFAKGQYSAAIKLYDELMGR